MRNVRDRKAKTSTLTITPNVTITPNTPNNPNKPNPNVIQFGAKPASGSESESVSDDIEARYGWLLIILSLLVFRFPHCLLSFLLGAEYMHAVGW